MERPQFWSPWESESLVDLAAYVCVDAVRFDERLRPEVNVVEEREGGSRRLGGERFGRLLFDRLQTRVEVRYDREPLSPLGFQYIRDPEWVLSESGTCLDLALMYAAMSADHRVRPYVVLMEYGGVAPDHALVVLDLDRTMEDDGPIRLGWPDGAEVEFRRGGHGGTDTQALAEACGNGNGLVPVEVTAATKGNRLDWAGATANAAHRLSKSDPDRVRLLDVQAAWDAGVLPLRPPAYRQPIRRNLPASDSGFVEYASRADVFASLTGTAGGTSVVIGAQGTGKSRMALEVAVRAPRGRAWFLNASTNETLRESLARAERRERFGPSGDHFDKEQIDEFATLALERLADAHAGWVVVLDNVRFAPSAAKWLPQPNEARGQHLIITTTEEAWADTSGVRVVRLDRLPRIDLPDWLEAEPVLVELADGRPLLIDALSRFRATVGHDELLQRTSLVTAERAAAGAPTDGPAVFCDSVLQTRGDEGTEDEGTEEVAGLVAWLPPDRIELDLLGRLTAASEAAMVLVAHGLFQALRPAAGDPIDAVSVHRLFAAAIRRRRNDMGPPDPAVLHLLADRSVVRLLGTSAEVEDFDRLHAELGGTDEVDRSYGLALHGLATAEELYTNVDRSSATFARALGHFDRDDGRDAALVADCLHGMARLINRREAKNAERVAEAVEMTREAIALRQGAGEVMAVGQSQAMLGILMKVQARERFVPPDQVELTLREAMRLIDESHVQRRQARINDPDDLDVARAMFNRGGVRVDLANLVPSDEVAVLLDEAEQAYLRTEDVRRRVLLRDRSDLVATCVAGRGIVDYCRATLLPDATGDERLAWLRRASLSVQSALADYEALSRERHDTGDVDKQNALLGKICLARVALRSAMTNPEDPGGLGALDAVVNKLREEVTAARFGS